MTMAPLALHYFLLATLYFVLIATLCLYRDTVIAVKFFKSPGSFRRRTVALGWLLPGLYVSICSMASHKNYASTETLLKGNFAIAIVLPAALLMCCNTYCLFAITNTLADVGRKLEKRQVLNLVSLMYLAFIFALVSYIHDHVLWQLMFTLATLLQAALWTRAQLGRDDLRECMNQSARRFSRDILGCVSQLGDQY